MIEIKKYSPTNHKVKAVVYGKSGSGKTTFAATAPKPIFASAEQGLLSVRNKDVDFVDIKKFEDFAELVLHLKKGGHNYETLVIDSITEINEIIKADIEKGGRAMQLQDWNTVARKIRATLRQCRDLDMHILFIAQEKMHEIEGEKPIRTPSLNGKAASDICYYMDIVGYAYVDKEGGHKIITSSNPQLNTKDRTNMIGTDENADFSEWVKKISKMETSEQEKVAEIDSIQAMKDEAINALPSDKDTPKKGK